MESASGMARDPSPDKAQAILQAARSGNLSIFIMRLGDFNVNFQADASAIDADSEQAPTSVERYATAYGIPEGWKKHIMENALPAFHEGRTSLHVAASNGQLEIVRHICKLQQRDINIRDKFDYTPLHLAAHSWHVKRDDVVAELLSCPDIDPNVVATKMGDGRLQSHPNTKSWDDTALHLATFLGFEKTVKQLLEWSPTSGKIIDVTLTNKRGFTPLHQAVNNGNMSRAVPITVALLKFINEHNPDVVNVSDNNKLTPLHIAVLKASYKLVILLLQAPSIDADKKDNLGLTPFDLAVRFADYNLVRMLQSHFERTGLYGDKQANVTAASTILVGASLFASVTFAAWLHPPSSYFQTIPDSYDALEHHWDIQMFWVFDSLSFYFAIATFLTAASVAIPSKGIRLAHIRSTIHMATFFVVLSILFAMGAFAAAGFVLLPHRDAYHWSMIGTIALVGTICLLGPFCLFLRQLLRATCPAYFYTDLIITSWLLHHVKDPMKNFIFKLKPVQRFVESYNSAANPDIMGRRTPYSDWLARVRAYPRAREYISKQYSSSTL